MQWYYSKAGNQFGPVSEAELKSKISTGEVSGADLVWKDSMSDWLPASQVTELSVPAAMPGAPSPYTPPTQPSAPSTVVSSYLWQSIAVTVLCCLPFGIVAIVNAAKVDGLLARGEYAAASAASAAAKKWCLISVVGFVVVMIAYAAFAAIAVSSVPAAR